MSLVLIAVNETLAVIASEGRESYRNALGERVIRREDAPKFSTLGPNFLAVTGSSDLIERVRQEAEARLPASFGELERFLPEMARRLHSASQESETRELELALALVGCEGDRVRCVSWISGEDFLPFESRDPKLDCIALGWKPIVQEAVGEVIERLRAAPSLNEGSISKAIRETVASLARHCNAINDRLFFGFVRTPIRQCDGAQRARNALTSGNNLASGIKVGGDSGLVGDRLADVVLDNSGIGQVKASAFNVANYGKVSTGQVFATTTQNSGNGWLYDGPWYLNIPAGATAVKFDMDIITPGTSGDVEIYGGGPNVGFSLMSSGSPPATPQASRTGPGSLSLSNPPIGAVSFYIYVRVTSGGANEVEGFAAMALRQPADVGYIT